MSSKQIKGYAAHTCMCATFTFTEKFNFPAIKKKAVIVFFFLMPSKQYSLPEEIEQCDDGLNWKNKTTHYPCIFINWI
jgi:hypothetical protein